MPKANTSMPIPAREDDPLADSVPVVTHHQITVSGKPLKYTTTAGRLLLKPESGATEAAIFFTALHAGRRRCAHTSAGVRI
ncbi:MAG TPA: hypothetical protein VGP89_04135 [Candidatus Angelobacter sp.]|nr:hypothetical protein [Candidatus Angelobacter sp.]